MMVYVVVERNGGLSLLLNLGGGRLVGVGLLVQLKGVVDHGGVLGEFILGLGDVGLRKDAGSSEVREKRQTQVPVEVRQQGLC